MTKILIVSILASGCLAIQAANSGDKDGYHNPMSYPNGYNFSDNPVNNLPHDYNCEENKRRANAAREACQAQGRAATAASAPPAQRIRCPNPNLQNKRWEEESWQ